MFFLGGFNSIIPYLLYLSLIWVFMIIGFHGKIVETWHLLVSREYQQEIIITSPPAHNIVILTPTAADYHQDKTIEPFHASYAFFPAIVYININIPGNFTPDITSFMHSFSFRGPPAFIS
jgi:hypothetical protein